MQVANVSKDELFQRARSWFNDAFKSSKDVLQIQDKETGELSGKGNISGTMAFKAFGSHLSSILVSFSMKILVKDGRYKYEAANFVHFKTGDSGEGYGILTSSNKNPNKYPMVSQKKLDDAWLSVKQSVESKNDSFIIKFERNNE